MDIHYNSGLKMQDLGDVEGENEQEKLAETACPNNIFICDMRYNLENVLLN